MTEPLEDRLAATLATRVRDVVPAPALYDQVVTEGRRRRRRTVGARLAAAAAVVVTAALVLPDLVAGTTLPWVDEVPSSTADVTAVEDPQAALFTTQDGALIGVDLATGERTELSPPRHGTWRRGRPSSTVIDLATSVRSTLDDFTAVAYDDGTDTGFVTWVRRDGGEVVTSFTPNADLPGPHSNRGFRTISPDGRWLAYHGLDTPDGTTLRLVPIDPVSALLDLDAEVELSIDRGPVAWTGPVAEVGDRSLLLHPDTTASILERSDDGFVVVEEVALDTAYPTFSPASAGGEPTRVAFGSLRPGARDDVRFQLSLRRAPAVLGEPPGTDRALVHHLGEGGGDENEVRFDLLPGSITPSLDARGHTALVVGNGGGAVTGDDAEQGAAWVVRVRDGGEPAAHLDVTGPIVRGVVSGALLGGR